MTAREFMDFLHILERLKCNTRHGWTSTGRRESVAEHSYRHNEAPLDTWIELERTLNLEYGTEDCARFPLLRELREIAAEDTRRKLADGK